MRLLNIIEADQKEKPRPPKTLWFDDYSSWVHDIKLRFPAAEAQKDNSTGDIIAVDSDGKTSYGVWRNERKLGVAYAVPRPLYSSVHPRSQLEKIK